MFGFIFAGTAWTSIDPPRVKNSQWLCPISKQRIFVAFVSTPLTCFLFAFALGGTRASSIDGCWDERHTVCISHKVTARAGASGRFLSRSHFYFFRCRRVRTSHNAPKGRASASLGDHLRRSTKIFKVNEPSQSRFILSLCCCTLTCCSSIYLPFGMLQVCEDEGHCAQWNTARRAIERCPAALPLSRFQWRPRMASISSFGRLHAKDHSLFGSFLRVCRHGTNDN